MKDDSQLSDPINQACLWVARLWADDASNADHEACQQWREADPQHEQAWQQLMSLQTQLRSLPDRQIGSKVLRSRSGLSRRHILTIGGIGLGVSALGIDRFYASVASGTTYATSTGEIRHISLEDGTQLVLNTTSEVQVNYDEHTRRVLLLKGEVRIETSPDVRPFSVVSRDALLQPLGTRFSVRQSGDDSQLKVYEGSVRVSPLLISKKPEVIPSGNGVTFSMTKISLPFAIDFSSEAWTQHRLAVANMPLTQFVNELSRYRTGYLRISPDLHSLTVTGIFSLDDTDRVLQQLTEILPVSVHYFSPYWVTVKPS